MVGRSLVRAAVAREVPVVATNHFMPENLGWLFPPGDVRALARRLAELFADPATLARMGAASRDLIARHDIGASLDMFETLYRVALGATTESLPVAA